MKKAFIIPAIALTTSLVFAQENAPAPASEAVPDSAEVLSNAPSNTPSDAPAPEAVADSATVSNNTPAPVTPEVKADTAAPQPKLAEGTPLGGSIHGFLKSDQSPYLVTENLSVDENNTLVIEPGVTLLFTPGTALYVKGQLVVAGAQNNMVQFRSASSMPKSGDWQGIFISGQEQSEIRNAAVSDAANGIAIENGNLSILSSKIEKSSNRGVYAKNSKLTINGSQFYGNEGAAVHIDSYSDASLGNIIFESNKVALYNAPLAITSVTSSRFENNDYGVLDMGNSHLSFGNTIVQNNKVGASAGDVLGPDVIGSIKGNEADFTKDVEAVAQALPASPEIPGIESRPVNKDERIGSLLSQKQNKEDQSDTTRNGWSVAGNIMVDNHYHYVATRKNRTGEKVEIMGDTIKPNQKYKNTFQVPGFGTEASAYLLMESPDGRTIEFNADYTGDSWNRFNADQVTLSYTDNINHLVLGDFNKSAGDIYMSSLPIFGAGYTLSLFKNNANQPLVEVDGFFGESRKPYLLDERHPYIYKNYIENGEAQAQRLAYGGSIKWAPLRRFDATIGAIYADDEIHDPLLRDGGRRSTITSEPMQQSFTVYADGNWLFYPGDIVLKGQVAVGRADTADVFRERAINEVFTKAGLNTSSMGKLRELMSNESKISALSANELDEIFGGNTTLSRSKMKDSLRTLIHEAKQLKSEADDERDDGRVMGLNWGSQNFALGASLYWNIYKTTLSGHLKYVGEDFYSAGSADQLADTREFGGEIQQEITDFWNMNFAYQINVENAANGGKTNLFGLGEGTRWGLSPNEDSKWYRDHELDNDRAKYIQDWKLGTEFKINPMVTANMGYNLEYRTQYRPYQLHGDYILEDGIYKDSWFNVRKNHAKAEIIDGGEIETVDSARWAQYMGMADEDYLASKFQERIFRNSWNAGLSVKVSSTIFKVGGIWTIRTDNSKFYKDSLIDEMDLSNETIAKLGYNFGGADYFEHSYPVSATSNFSKFQNYFSVTPRFKNYKRDDMSESEISVEDELEIAFLRRFLIVDLTGQFRYLTSSWEEDSEDIDEKEYDVLGQASLTVNHTKRLSSQWYVGTAMYYRPDDLSEEYKDVYGGIKVNYAF